MKKTSIYVGGTFDCFHAGHVNLLRRAREIADYVIVALNSDAFTTSYKGKPVMNELERLQVVRACRYVDLAFVMESHAMQRVYMEMLRPDFILHGDDWTGDSLVRQLGIDEAFLQEHGIRMKYVPYTQGVSTSDVKRRILAVDATKGATSAASPSPSTMPTAAVSAGT
jgi:glycerol-3-phosphate cytidylyltransferase